MQNEAFKRLFGFKALPSPLLKQTISHIQYEKMCLHRRQSLVVYYGCIYMNVAIH